MNRLPANSDRRSGSKHGHHQAGVGLIEILIAVVVLAVGILGLAALQTRALGNSGNSMGRSVATIASYSILEAMRADRTKALGGGYNRTVNAADCPDAGATLAVNQLRAWCQQLGDSLGAVDTTTGQVDCDANGHCTITIDWSDTRTDTSAGGGTQALVTAATL